MSVQLGTTDNANADFFLKASELKNKVHKFMFGGK